MVKIPSFDDLHCDPKGPKGNAWGLFGNNDLGMLNLLTSEVVKEASKEIQDGVRVSLDWALNMPANPSFDRKPFKVEMVNRTKPGQPLRAVNDDVLTFNTQCSSQWDGFRHYGHQKSMCFFNGYNQDQLESSSVLGIDSWLDAGGLAGRGVLLDYVAWASHNSIPIDAFTSTAVPLRVLQEIATASNITFRPGDILFIRCGFTKAYNALSPSDEALISQRPTPDFIGVEAGEATLRWLWQNQFAAVASDAPSFERAPIAGPHADIEHMLHQWLLPRWGMPIGEMFDLERLAEECERRGRWSFFVTSAPLRVPGGVASPPNAIAIF